MAEKEESIYGCTVLFVYLYGARAYGLVNKNGEAVSWRQVEGAKALRPLGRVKERKR